MENANSAVKETSERITCPNNDDCKQCKYVIELHGHYFCWNTNSKYIYQEIDMKT
jgi:hypothetical protein